jgi:hypothetical protein
VALAVVVPDVTRGLGTEQPGPLLFCQGFEQSQKTAVVLVLIGRVDSVLLSHIRQEQHHRDGHVGSARGLRLNAVACRQSSSMAGQLVADGTARSRIGCCELLCWLRLGVCCKVCCDSLQMPEVWPERCVGVVHRGLKTILWAHLCTLQGPACSVLILHTGNTMSGMQTQMRMQ